MVVVVAGASTEDGAGEQESRKVPLVGQVGKACVVCVWGGLGVGKGGA